jgi:LPS-assembly protein
MFSYETITFVTYHMKLLRKFRLKYLLTGMLTVVLLFTVTWKTAARHASPVEFCTGLTTWQDTTKPLSNKDSALKRTNPTNDTVPVRRSLDTGQLIITTDTFSLKLSKDTLDAPVEYEAEDSAVVMVKEKKIILYGRTTTKYKDITLTAPTVELDQQTNILTATSSKDSLGEIVERARFKQAENDFQSDTIRFNFKTQRGLTKNTFTQQGELYVKGDDIKKINASTVYVKSARFTTCNLDEPHFAFRTNKLKIINNKIAISGPTHPEFEGVPVPIYLPFGFYPLSQGRHSGLLPATFEANEQYGLGLIGLGYYKVINEYYDITFRANVYSYGGWTANISPSYRKRYRYNGGLNFSIQNTKINFKGDPDYLKNKSYFITWNHNVDSRARPGTNFSASVNAGSSKYNELVPNNPNINFQNQLSSSITYSKTWTGKPYNLTLSANHNQNNRSRLINVSIPDVGFTVTTIYPFQSQEAVGTPKWYEKLGIAYSGTFRNQISFYDTAFKLRQLLDTLQWGAQHNIPISLSLPPVLGGRIVISPSVSYNQIWIAQKFRRSWDTAARKVDTSINKGFYTDHQMQMGIGLSTALFGTFNFKHSKIIAIRHTFRPSISASYKPDLSRQHFYSTQIDTSGHTVRFSEFDGSLYGFYPEGRYGGIGLTIDNSLEAKYRSRKDTGDAAIKKIRLIDGFGLSTGYNFIADSFRLSTVQLYFRSTLFEKINITAGATLDPYEVDKRGFRVNKLAWQGGKVGRITTGNVAISTEFKSKPKDAKVEEQRKQEDKQRFSDPALIGDQQRLMDYMRQNPGEFVDFNIPWRLSISFSLFFSERMKSDYSGFETDFSANTNFQGSFSLTPKWNFSLNGYYNLDTRKLQTFQMSISRDMHCWQMSIGVTPVGPYRFFNISINPKAAVLQDLRINRTRSFTNF